MRYGVVLVAGVSWLAACGGHTRGSADEPMSRAGATSSGGADAAGGSPSGSTSQGGAPIASGGVATAGTAPSEAGTAPSEAGTGAVGDPGECMQGVYYAGCRSGVSLPLSLDGRTEDPMLAWAEPVTVPMFPPRPPGTGIALPVDPSPEEWDRGAPPAGACVVRVHDVEPGCMAGQTSLQLGSCEENASSRSFESFYRTPWCTDEIAPGCPSAEAWPEGRQGAWWYVLPQANPVASEEPLLVICAPLCALIQEAGGACLVRLTLAI
jgi:hypothetical protein